MNKLAELRAKAKAIADEMDTIAKKGNELEAGDISRIDVLYTEDAQVRADIEAEVAKSQKAAELAGRAAATRSFLNDPVRDNNTQNHPGFGERADTVAGNGHTITYSNAGETFLTQNKNGGVEITNTGRGLLSASKYAKISERGYNDAFVEYVARGGRVDQMSIVNVRALQEGLDDEGGYLVPPEMALRLIQRLPTPTSLNPHYFAWQTSRDAVVFPKVQYTGSSTDDPNAILYSTGVRMIYPGELPNSSSTIIATQPNFGETRIPVYTAMACLDVSRNMIDDSPIGILNFIESKFQETASLEYDNRSLNGTGVNQATGMLLAPQSSATNTIYPQYVASGAASALTADGIKALAFGLAPQYAARARFAMNWMGTAQAISELKDGTGRYLWSDGLLNDGLAATILNRRLLGFECSYSEFFPSVAANAYPIIFGDLAGYYLVQRLGLSIQILFETKAKQNMLEVVARMRFGGNLAEPWRVKVQKVSVS